MERDEAQSRKRGREQESETKQNKKQPEVVAFVEDCSYTEKHYEFYDSIGVFDFPWLKDGVVFKAADEFSEHEDVFSRYSRDLSHVPEYGTFGAGCVDDGSCVQSSPDSDRNLHVVDDEKGISDGLWPLVQADDLEPLDCVWSSVIDQPPKKA